MPGRQRRGGPACGDDQVGIRETARSPLSGQLIGGRIRSRDHRPGNLGGLSVFEEIPAEPVAEMLDYQQAAPAFVVFTGLRGHRDAKVAVTDEDGQLALVKGEDQPDDGPVQGETSLHGIGNQLARDEFGGVRQFAYSPPPQDLAGPGAGAARCGEDRAQVEEGAGRPARSAAPSRPPDPRSCGSRSTS